MATKKSFDIISFLEEYFMKLPPISKNARVNISNILPWLALIFGILGVLFSLVGLIVLTVASPLMLLGGGVHLTANAFLGTLLGAVGSVCLLASFPGVRAHTFRGWRLLFWSEIIGAISSALQLSLTGILIAALGMYILFQVKSLYK